MEYNRLYRLPRPLTAVCLIQYLRHLPLIIVDNIEIGARKLITGCITFFYHKPYTRWVNKHNSKTTAQEMERNHVLKRLIKWNRRRNSVSKEETVPLKKISCWYQHASLALPRMKMIKLKILRKVWWTKLRFSDAHVLFHDKIPKIIHVPQLYRNESWYPWCSI